MEYFSIFSHGQLLDNKKLDPVDRKLNNEYIPIIMFGTQSHITQHGFTLFYYILFTKNYGINFLNELVHALKEHPQHYAKLYQVGDSENIYQKAVRYLFDINLKELETFPQNKFRVFVRGDLIRQPLDIFLNTNGEMVVGKINQIDEYTKSLVDRQVNRLDPMFDYIDNNRIGSIPMLHKIKKSKIQYGKSQDAIGFVYPYGLYKTTHLSNFEFQDYHQNRLSQLTKKLIETAEIKNKRKLMFRNPTFHEIGAIIIFSCKTPLSKTIRNFEFPQQQQSQDLFNTPPIVSTTLKLFFDEKTNKFVARSVPTLETILYKHEKETIKHLKNIEKKRKERKQKKEKQDE